MLTIRPDQLAALEDHRLAQLAVEVAKDFRARALPAAEGLEDDVLRERILLVLRQAYAHGLRGTAPLHVVASITFQMNLGVVDHPEAARILAASRPDQEKVRALLDWLAAGAWIDSLDRFGKVPWS